MKNIIFFLLFISGFVSAQEFQNNLPKVDLKTYKKPKIKTKLLFDGCEYKIFTDERDDQQYRTITIGNQTWMAENMRYKVSGAYSNRNNPSVYYGLLYNWSQAKSACPSGWHLPTNADWDLLAQFIARDGANALKSKTGWYNNANGTNKSCFNALPAGHFFEGNSDTGLPGYYASFWSADMKDNANVWGRTLTNDAKFLKEYRGINGFHSCRCVKD